MDYEVIYRKDQDVDRGVALLIAGAVMVLLKWVLPPVAPLAVLAYGVYRLYLREFAEGGVAIAVAVVLWFLRAPVEWLLWLAGVLMAGFGLFFLIRGLRGHYQLS